MALSMTYNGTSSNSFTTAGRPWLHVRSKPNIPGAVENFTSYRIPGREAPLIVKDGTYDPIKITVNLGFRMNPSDWHTKLNSVFSWLQNPNPSNPVLSFSHMSVNYKVLQVEVGELQKESPKIWFFPVIFTCEAIPYEADAYQGPYEIGNSFTIQTSGPPYARPLFRFNVTHAGEVYLHMPSTNKNVHLNLVSTGMIYVDTDLMMMYRVYGSKKYNLSAYVTGSYRDLWQLQNSNSYLFSKAAASAAEATLTVYPRKRAYI